MPVKGHTHDEEGIRRTADAWCDDATANRVVALAKKIHEELGGVHSDYRRERMREMARKLI